MFSYVSLKCNENQYVFQHFLKKTKICDETVSAGLAAFYIVFCCFRHVSAGLAAFCEVLCGFGLVSAGLDWSRCVLYGFVWFGLVSRVVSLLFLLFWVGFCWSRCVLYGFVLFWDGLCWSRCVLCGFVLFWAGQINLCKSDPGHRPNRTRCPFWPCAGPRSNRTARSKRTSCPFCVVLGWSLLVLYCFGIISAGLAAFCVVLCGFGPVSAGFCWSRCVLCGFGLVSAGLAVFVWFCVVLGWCCRDYFCGSLSGCKHVRGSIKFPDNKNTGFHDILELSGVCNDKTLKFNFLWLQFQGLGEI